MPCYPHFERGYEELELELHTRFMEARVPVQEIKVTKDTVFDQLVFSVKNQMYKHELKTSKDYTLDVDTPLNWWEHFKRDVLGVDIITRWIIKKWPVKYYTTSKTVTANFSNNILYPDITVENERKIFIQNISFNELGT